MRGKKLRAAVTIQRIFRGYRAREVYKARKVLIDIENMHQKYKRIRAEFIKQQKQSIGNIWEKRRVKGLALGLKLWLERSRILKSIHPPKSQLPYQRPSALTITPTWKSKTRRIEPQSAGLDSTPTRGSESYHVGYQMLRRKSTMTRHLDTKPKPEKGYKSEIKELPSGPDTEPSTPDSGQALKLLKK